MSPVRTAIRVGLRRGWAEFRHALARPDEYAFDVLIAVIVLIVLYFQRDDPISGTSLSRAAVTLPGVVGALIAFTTLLAAALAIASEREDGTLLRARAAPFGVVGYVAGQVVRIPLATVRGVVLLLIPGLFLVEGLAGTGISAWLTLLWVLALGLLATLPLGLVFGALAKSPRTPAQTVGLVSTGLIAISGIFYPLSALPSWLQETAQVFPFYWLGLGVRSALLPDSAAAGELSGGWRHLETVGVLGAWALVGLVVAPMVLRTATRRQSGASVEAARRRAAQRIG